MSDAIICCVPDIFHTNQSLISLFSLSRSLSCSSGGEEQPPIRHAEPSRNSKRAERRRRKWWRRWWVGSPLRVLEVGGVCLCVCVVVQILKNNQNVGSEVSDAHSVPNVPQPSEWHTYLWLCMSYVSWTVVIVMSPTGLGSPGTKRSNQSWCLWVFTNPCDERGGSDYNVPFISQCKV